MFSGVDLPCALGRRSKGGGGDWAFPITVCRMHVDVVNNAVLSLILNKDSNFHKFCRFSFVHVSGLDILQTCTLFFYKNIFCKNMDSEICEILRIF